MGFITKFSGRSFCSVHWDQPDRTLSWGSPAPRVMACQEFSACRSPTHNQLRLLSLQSLSHLLRLQSGPVPDAGEMGTESECPQGGSWVSSHEVTECHYPATTPNVSWATGGSPPEWCRHIRPEETRSLFMNRVLTMYSTWCPHGPTGVVPIDRRVNRMSRNKPPRARTRAGILDHAVMRGIGLNSLTAHRFLN